MFSFQSQREVFSADNRSFSFSQRSMDEQLDQLQEEVRLGKKEAASKAFKKELYDKSCVSYSVPLVSFLVHRLPSLVTSDGVVQIYCAYQNYTERIHRPWELWCDKCRSMIHTHTYTHKDIHLSHLVGHWLEYTTISKAISNPRFTHNYAEFTISIWLTGFEENNIRLPIESQHESSPSSSS